MNTHGRLTESSRTDSLRAPDRKGREGKGREQEGRGRPFQDQVDLLTAGAPRSPKFGFGGNR